MAASFEISIVAGRKAAFSGTLEDANAAAIAITAGSKVYCKLYRGAGATPDLDIRDIALSGGSVTTFTAGSGAGVGGYTVTFEAADTTALTPGAYDCEIDLVDAGDSSKIKHAQFGVIHVIGQPLGGTT